MHSPFHPLLDKELPVAPERIQHDLFFDLCVARHRTILAAADGKFAKSDKLVTNLISRLKYIGNQDGNRSAP